MPQKKLRIAAHMKPPRAMFAGVVNCRHPSPSRIMLCGGLRVFETLYFQYNRDTAFQSHDKVGFVMVVYALKFVRNQESEMIIADVEINRVCLFQSERRTGLPRLCIEHDLIDMTFLRPTAGPCGFEIDLRRGGEWFVPIQHGQQGRFPFFVIGVNRITQVTNDSRGVFFKTELSRILVAKIDLAMDIITDKAKHLRKELMPRYEAPHAGLGVGWRAIAGGEVMNDKPGDSEFDLLQVRGLIKLRPILLREAERSCLGWMTLLVPNGWRKERGRGFQIGLDHERVEAVDVALHDVSLQGEGVTLHDWKSNFHMRPFGHGVNVVLKVCPQERTAPKRGL